jgi:SAM-dependent methyltransferase
LRFVAAAVPDGTGKRLLDIGCGDGSFLLAARQLGWNVMGTELNPGPGRDAGLEVVESLERIPGEAAFDCITMWHTLEHMPDIVSTLSHITRLLKPAGYLIVAVPDAGGLQATLFGREWLHADVPRHLFHFDGTALRHCLGTAGYSVRRTWHQELEYDLLGWSQSALNLLGIRTNLFFDFLRGQGSRVGAFHRVGGIALGAMLTVLFLPALALGTLLGRGGTLVVIAGRPGATGDGTD